MKINDMVRLQEGMKQFSSGKNYDVFRMLLGQKDVSTAKKPAADSYIPASVGTQSRSPDWTTMPSKSEPAMSEAEFENSIKQMALEYAERATEIGNSGKSKSVINKQIYDLNREFEVKEEKLRKLFVSVVSPDRKALYAKYDGENPFLYGSDGKMSMIAGPTFWAWAPTEEEEARISKYFTIRRETLNAYEAEHGQIPHTTISKSFMI